MEVAPNTTEKRDWENIPVAEKLAVHEEYHLPIRLSREDEEFLANFSNERRKKVLRKVSAQFSTLVSGRR